MSRFKTIIPVPVAEVKAALPGNAYFHGIKLNDAKDAVVIEWEHDDFKTGYTFAVDFPLATLQARGVPDGVKFSGKPAPTAESEGNLRKNVAESAVGVDSPKKSRKKSGVGNGNA